jgi:hypothetical protein
MWRIRSAILAEVMRGAKVLAILTGFCNIKQIPKDVEISDRTSDYHFI